jgi:chaperonin cofactor prefoldin
LKKEVLELQAKYNAEYIRAEKFEKKIDALEMENKNLKEKIEELEEEL